MKKFVVLVLALVFALSCIGAVSADDAKRVAVICDTIGTNLFLTQVVDMVEQKAGELGYDYSIMECADTDEWKNNYEAATHEDYDLIVGVGWQSAEFAAENATADGPKFAVIDTDAGSEYVASFSYNEEQAAYIMGLMAGKAFPNEDLYGYIGCFDGAGSWKYRWGFMEGVKVTNPNAKFTFNWTNSYTDPTNAHEFALQMQAMGATYIFGGAAACNNGIFQAALELAKDGKFIYSIGQDADETREDNPYILSSQLKNTGVTMGIILDKFYDGTLEGGLTELKLADGAIGATWVTNDGAYLNSEVLTDEVLDFCKGYVQDIIDGKVVLELPDESTYDFNIAQ